jgi:hypothetical protein
MADEDAVFSVRISKAEFLANPTLPELDNLIAMKIRDLKKKVTVRALRVAFLDIPTQEIPNAGIDGNNLPDATAGDTHDDAAVASVDSASPADGAT